MKFLINPFEIYSEKKLLLVGIILALVAALVASYTSHIIYGSLKIINNYHQSWYVAIINLSITLLSNTLLLFLFARARYSKTRIIDVVNVVLISHITVYAMLFLTALPIVQQAITAIELELLDKGFQTPTLSKIHAVILGAFGALILSLLGYFFYLLIVGMKIAINSKSKVDMIVIILLVLAWNIILQLVDPFV